MAFENFFKKKESYYEPDSKPNSKNSSPVNLKDENRVLKKENQKLKEGLKTHMLEIFKTRRSIRKFSDQDIDWDVIYNIIDSALNAPCAGNVQNYKVLMIKDKKKKHELGKLAFQQYWLSDAPVLLIVTRDNYHLEQLYPLEGKTYSIQNTAAFIQNLLMLIHAHDLGACWVEAFDNDVLKEYLGIPRELRVDAIIPVGYPLERPTISKTPTDHMVFYENYGNKKRK